MRKTAQTQVPILDLIAERWSPRAFLPRLVEHNHLIGLLEAARWAASSRNLQPWNFIVATREKPQDYTRLFECLSENNQRWAGSAPLLIMVVATVENNGAHNRVALYDSGLAVGNLTAQAMHSGLMLRQMGGFDRDKARQLYNIPATHEPVVVLAIGYPAPVESMPEDMRTRESAPRARKPLSEFVFSGTWGQGSHVLGEPAGTAS
ncbi:MAG: nitroreductase [Anaerolineaceae bacterium]|nr:nitroreductase [Anaerolineaceae bacterium]